MPVRDGHTDRTTPTQRPLGRLSGGFENFRSLFTGSQPESQPQADGLTTPVSLDRDALHRRSLPECLPRSELRRLAEAGSARSASPPISGSTSNADVLSSSAPTGKAGVAPSSTRSLDAGHNFFSIPAAKYSAGPLESVRGLVRQSVDSGLSVEPHADQSHRHAWWPLGSAQRVSADRGAGDGWAARSPRPPLIDVRNDRRAAEAAEIASDAREDAQTGRSPKAEDLNIFTEVYGF